MGTYHKRAHRIAKTMELCSNLTTADFLPAIFKSNFCLINLNPLPLLEASPVLLDNFCDNGKKKWLHICKQLTFCFLGQTYNLRQNLLEKEVCIQIHTGIYAHEETKSIREYVFQTNKMISNKILEKDVLTIYDSEGSKTNADYRQRSQSVKELHKLHHITP